MRGFGASTLFKGKTIKEIARDLRVSRNMVRKVMRSGETSFEYEREVQPRPKLGRWTSKLNQLLAGNEVKPARERLTLIRIFEELRGAVMTGATMPYGATPDGGPRSGAQRRPRPMCR